MGHHKKVYSFDNTITVFEGFQIGCHLISGNLGCASDVLRVVDTKCSGMKECSMLLPNPKLMEMLSCPKGVTSYMDAAYTCVKGRQKAQRTICFFALILICM